MSIYLAILILFALAAACLLVLALYLVPVEIIGTIEKRDGIESRFSVSWGVFTCRFVLAEEQGLDLYFGKRHLYHRFIDGGTRKEASQVGKDEASPRLPLSQLIDAWPHIQKLFLRILRCVTFRRLSCDLQFGLASPVETGIAYGYLWAFKGLLTPFPRVQLSMTPVFDRRMLVCSGMAHLAVERPLVVLFAVATVMTRKPVRRLMAAGGNA